MSLCHYFKAGCGTEKGLLQTTLCQYLSDPCFFHIFFSCLFLTTKWVGLFYCILLLWYCHRTQNNGAHVPSMESHLASKSFLFYYTRYFVIAMENKYMTSPFSVLLIEPQAFRQVRQMIYHWVACPRLLTKFVSMDACVYTCVWRSEDPFGYCSKHSVFLFETESLIGLDLNK